MYDCCLVQIKTYDCNMVVKLNFYNTFSVTIQIIVYVYRFPHV